jgi:hypothetical protein
MKVAEHDRVQMIWVPGHRGIEGKGIGNKCSCNLATWRPDVEDDLRLGVLVHSVPRLPAAAAQPAKVRQSCSATDYYCW